MSELEIEPLRDEELAALPVFPAAARGLLPGERPAAHVFERRYRAMMEDCVSRGPRAIVVALLEPGWESDYEGRPPVHEIAGAGRIVDFARRDDGRFDLLLHGLTRVRLEELPAEGLAYRRARCARRCPIGSRTPPRSSACSPTCSAPPPRSPRSCDSATRASSSAWIARRRRASSPIGSPIG
ncbi:MAG: LON peptidase substrate-binding domain-containing protein [Sandaracinaceae bacterium]|nr:LON peptidase substrate-binding domain-containing protein [Sandaracinaceae bacterium]